MRRRSGWLLVAGAAWSIGLACSSGSSKPGADTDEPGLDSGVQPYDGSVSSDSAVKHDGAASDAAGDGLTDAPTEAGDSGNAGDAGDADVQVTPPSDAPMADPTCNPLAKLTAPVAVPGIPTFQTQPLITMTSDELTMAWVVDNTGEAVESGLGGTGVFVADRASTTASFGQAIQIDAPLDGGSYFTFDRVAISGDGLTLTAVQAGARNMASFIRTARGQAFAPFELTTPYAAIIQSLNTGELVGDPVVSPDGDDLVVSEYNLPNAAVTVYESFRSTADGATPSWPAGSPQSGVPLEMKGGDRKHPLSMSADRLTLFVWDNLTSMTYGAFRNSPTGQFSVTEPWGALLSMQTNGACNAFYYVAKSGSTYSVVQVQNM